MERENRGWHRQTVSGEITERWREKKNSKMSAQHTGYKTETGSQGDEKKTHLSHINAINISSSYGGGVNPLSGREPYTVTSMMVT